MSSITYMNADLWETVNILTMTTHMLMQENRKYDSTEYEINDCYRIFEQLQKTDFDVLYQKHKYATSLKFRDQLKSKDSEQKFDYLQEIANQKLDEYETEIHQKCVAKVLYLSSYHSLMLKISPKSSKNYVIWFMRSFSTTSCSESTIPT